MRRARTRPQRKSDGHRALRDTTRRAVIRRWLTLGAMAAALAGCGEEAEAPRAATAPPPAVEGGPRPVELEVYRPRRGGTALDVVYSRGTDERFLRTVVREDARAVRVTVEVFSPSAGRQSANVFCALVGLRRPLGDRRVLDAAGRPVPRVSRRTPADPRDLLLPRRRCSTEG